MRLSEEPRTHPITVGSCEGGACSAAAPLWPLSARGEQSYGHLALTTTSQSSDHSELEEGFQCSLLASELVSLLEKRLEAVGSRWGMRAPGCFSPGGVFAVVCVPWRGQGGAGDSHCLSCASSTLGDGPRGRKTLWQPRTQHHCVPVLRSRG